MSTSTPLRRLAPRCLYSTPPTRLPHHPPQQQRCTATSDSNNQGGDDAPPRPNPILEEYRRNLRPSAPTPAQPIPRAGDISASSIFEDDRRAAAQQAAKTSTTNIPDETSSTPARDPAHSARVLDPDPNARERWLRKKVIQSVRSGGRLTKEQFIKRTEREHLAKSENMKTSTKKLGMLARQIAGKTVDEAIVQMRFSGKKVAVEVLKHLEAARDEAVVSRGMGLGLTPPVPAVSASGKADSSSVVGPDTTKPLAIQLKDGSRHTVSDTSTMYIDQAWVGRGPYGKLPDYRARGRVFIMHTPWTSLSLVLKEEATRVREWREREEKRHKLRLGRVWVPLPDRPVRAGGQWYAW